MEKNFLFIMTPVQIPDAREQLSKALEQLTELCSRTRYPRLWKLTDKLNSMPKLPEEKLRFRRIYRSVLGIINWVLGVLLLMTGLMEPEMIILLAAGAAGYGVGTVILWRRLRKTGGIINLLLGLLLCFGALGNPDALGRMLYLGIPALVIGIASLIPWRRKKKNPYAPAAEILLSQQQEMAVTRVLFSDGGAEIDTGGQKQPVSYNEIVCIIASKDLYLLGWKDGLTVLQKADLQEQTAGQFAAFIRQKIAWIEI